MDPAEESLDQSQPEKLNDSIDEGMGTENVPEVHTPSPVPNPRIPTPDSVPMHRENSPKKDESMMSDEGESEANEKKEEGWKKKEKRSMKKEERNIQENIPKSNTPLQEQRGHVRPRSEHSSEAEKLRESEAQRAKLDLRGVRRPHSESDSSFADVTPGN